MNSAFARILPDGKRLHLQQGPIDLVIDADGDEAEVALAFEQEAHVANRAERAGMLIAQDAAACFKGLHVVRHRLVVLALHVEQVAHGGNRVERAGMLIAQDAAPCFQ